MKMQSGSDFGVKFPGTLPSEIRQQLKAAAGNVTRHITEQMSMALRQQEITRGISNRNALSREQLEKYLSLYNSRNGHFDTPQSGDAPGGIFDVAVYQAPFQASNYRWSYSASGANFSINEYENRIYDAELGITGNQIAVSLGVNSNDQSIYFTSENVSLLLINHPMKTTGYLRVVAFIQCIEDTDNVQIIDHSQEITIFGDVGLGSSNTSDSHSLYVDINGENVGKNSFYSADVVPFDTDDHNYSNLDTILPSELRTLGITVPARFNEGQVVPLWVGTGTSSNSNSIGQEIRTITLQSWKVQEVWVITESTFNP